MKADAFRLQTLGKADIFRQKPIARMHGLRARCLAGGNHGIDIEIAFGGGRWPQPHGFVGHQHGFGKAVGIGIDRNGCDPQFLQRTDDAHGDFAAIGNQNFFEHGLRLIVPNQHADRGRIEAVAGIVDLRAIGNDQEHIHLGLHFHIVAGR